MKSRYSLHPGYAHMAAIERKLAENTGLSVFEWVVQAKSRGPSDPKALKAWLTGQGLGAIQAGCVVDRVRGEAGPESYDPEGLVANLFCGKREWMLPIYEQLLELGFSLGEDVRACPCATMVPLYRNHVFAHIKPTTLTRIDLGLALRDLAVPKRLIDTGGFAKKDRITHRIVIESATDIDDDVRSWLQRAYDLDA